MATNGVCHDAHILRSSSCSLIHPRIRRAMSTQVVSTSQSFTAYWYAREPFGCMSLAHAVICLAVVLRATGGGLLF